MHTPTAAARRTPDPWGRPRKRQLTWPRILDAAKPLTSLAGILAMYLLTDLAALTLLPMLFALLTVAATRDHRAVVFATAATATAMAATPYIHGDVVSLPEYTLPRLAAAGVAVAAGLWLRAARTRADAQAEPGTSRQA